MAQIIPHGTVYRLYSPSLDKEYIGLTTKTIQQRLQQHKSNYRGWLRNYIPWFCRSFVILEAEDYAIETIAYLRDKPYAELVKLENSYITERIAAGFPVVNRNNTGTHVKAHCQCRQSSLCGEVVNRSLG